MRHFFSEEGALEHRPIYDLQMRAVWIGLALVLQSLNEVKHELYEPLLQPFGSLIPFTLILGSFYAIWQALRPARASSQEVETPSGPRLWQRLVLLLTVLLVLPGILALGWSIRLSVLDPQFTNDGTTLDTNAAILLLQGRDPYTDSNMPDIVHRFTIQSNWTTPLRVGQFANRLDYPSDAELDRVFKSSLKANFMPEFEAKVSYPALSFLTLVPFALMKDYNVLIFYLACYLLLVALAWRICHPALRPWILLLSLANIPMWTSTIGGNLDVLYILLIVLAWLQRERRWQSALFFGLALATKQLAWYFIPFYMLMIWRNQSFKEMFVRMLVATGLALAINLPFILWNPQGWLAGVLAPLVDPMFPLGIGLINLSVTHLLPFLPEKVYTGLELGTLVGALIFYWFHCRKHPELALLLAVVPLFFAWRSLPSYFYCVAYPTFILLVARIQPPTRPALTAGTSSV